ncbi:Fn3-like domain-containing protein [Chryseobacterium sp. Ch-15]|uniref:Fn3-like domain-containing protein n=2 Tax=Chryseobacterium muglaense TaxID=2893752 RepID=A0A9Q3YUB9_9FLAO|nr:MULTISPECIES: Fn3-like domain-containing protein [Chryseobacterium]MCC9033520.1 Fn3-like domain-containing protein [Chryseobacterium muglaense]MCM2556835.1 Fn3-like domain-containing protein [Chryseobacterium muglaense]
MRTFIHLFIFFIFIGSSSILAQSISMSPTRLFFTGNPGEKVTQTVTLQNSSDKDYVFNLNYKDWVREEDGNKVYLDAGSSKTSNAAWVSTLENAVTIPAKSTKEIVVTMQIPANASKSDVTNSMLFFTQLPQQADQARIQNGIGIITLFEVGLHIFYTPSGNHTKSLDITNISEVSNEKAANRKVSVSIQNDGNTINDATVEFELTNTDTGKEIKLPAISISMLPKTNQVVQFSLPENISGNFLGVAIIKMAGSNDLRVGEKNFKF